MILVTAFDEGGRQAKADQLKEMEAGTRRGPYSFFRESVGTPSRSLGSFYK